MYTYLDFKCWEIMNCDNLHCPARHEPDVHCWEIAQKLDAYHNTSNTCRDCVVFLLKDETSEMGRRKLQKIMKQRVHFKDTDNGHQICL